MMLQKRDGATKDNERKNNERTTHFLSSKVISQAAQLISPGHKPTPTHAQTLLGIFFALTGALITTSIVNVGDSGVPFYTLALCAPIVVILYTGFRPHRFTLFRAEFRAFLGIGLLLTSLFCVLLMHLALDLQQASKEISHAAMRMAFIAYCMVCIYCLQGGTLTACMIWLRRILAFLALYGVYQLPAKVLGLPLFLDWLRNNPSFDIYDYNAAGWINLVRATSIYAEPSQCTVPLVVLVLLNIYVPSPKYSKYAVVAIALLFAALTFSRTVWIALFGVVLGIFIARSKIACRLFKGRPMLFSAGILLSILIFPLWAFMGGNYKSDLSRQERAGSIVIGLQIIKNHPFIGSGWNSYETLMPQYQITVDEISPEVEFRTIHNMFVSYVEQAGIFGFILAVFPFMLILFATSSPMELRLASLFSLLASAELGGDVGYSSMFWLWVAILLNWGNSDYHSAAGESALAR